MTFFDWVRGAKEEPKEEKKTPFEFSTHMIRSKTPSEYADTIFQKKLPVPPETMANDADNLSGNGFVDLKSLVAMNNVPLSNELFGWYASQSFIGYQACAVLSQNWLISKACSAIGEDSTRNGWDISVNDGEELTIEHKNVIIESDKNLHIIKNLFEFSNNLRIFGVRILIFKVKSNDKRFYEKPFNIDGVTPGSYQGIAQVDPYWCTPIMTSGDVLDPDSINFYEPEYWIIGGRKYHRSHLIIGRYIDVPDILKPTYLYGGMPLTQLISERVYGAERTANEAPLLTQTKRTDIQKTDLNLFFANPQKAMQRMQERQLLRNNFATTFIGLDDEVGRLDTNLSDLDSVIMTQYQLVASVADVPATRLLGTSPKGFNSTGEQETRQYMNKCKTCQTKEFMPILDMHYQILMRSLGFDYNLTVTFNPLWENTDKDNAEINNMKADYLGKLQQTGVIDAYDIGSYLNSDPKSGFSGISTNIIDPREQEMMQMQEMGEDPNGSGLEEGMIDGEQNGTTEEQI